MTRELTDEQIHDIADKHLGTKGNWVACGELAIKEALAFAAEPAEPVRKTWPVGPFTVEKNATGWYCVRDGAGSIVALEATEAGAEALALALTLLPECVRAIRRMQGYALAGSASAEILAAILARIDAAGFEMPEVTP